MNLVELSKATAMIDESSKCGSSETCGRSWTPIGHFML